MKNKGFILSSVLFFILAISLLSYIMLDISLIEIKSVNQYQKQRNNEILLFSFIKKIKYPLNRKCEEALQGNNYYAEKAQAWWRKNSCQTPYGDFIISYVSEKLRSSECLYVESKKKLKQGGTFYRLTFRLDNNSNHPKQEQAVYLFPKKINAAPPCEKEKSKTVMKSGLQAWRDLS